MSQTHWSPGCCLAVSIADAGNRELEQEACRQEERWRYMYLVPEYTSHMKPLGGSYDRYYMLDGTHALDKT